MWQNVGRANAPPRSSIEILYNFSVYIYIMYVSRTLIRNTEVGCIYITECQYICDTILSIIFHYWHKGAIPCSKWWSRGTREMHYTATTNKIVLTLAQILRGNNTHMGCRSVLAR